MKLKVRQCQVGRFNLIGNEESLSFIMDIVDNNVETIKEGKTRARLYYSGEPNEQDDFADALDNVSYVFSKALGYANRTWSSTDYKAECLLFYKLYKENFGEISDNYSLSRKNELEKQIESLQEELGNCSLNDDRENMEYELLNEIKKEEKSLAYYTEKQKEYNINSKSYAENAEYIKKIEDRIKLLSNLTAPSVEQGKESTDISSETKK